MTYNTNNQVIRHMFFQQLCNKFICNCIMNPNSTKKTATFGEARVQKINLQGQVVLPLPSVDYVQQLTNQLIQCLVGTLKDVAPDQADLVEAAINGEDPSDEDEDLTSEDEGAGSDGLEDVDHSNVADSRDEKEMDDHE